MLTFTPPNDPHRADTEYELKLLSHYWEITQAAVVAADETTQAEFNTAVAEVEDESLRSYYATQFLSIIRRYREELPSRLRYGFILQLYSLLETRSRALCEEAAKREDHIPLSLDELSGGRHMHGVFIFLKKLLGVKITLEKQLNRLRIIRNCIAHANGRVLECENSRQIFNAARASKGVKIDGEGYLNLSVAYCESSLEQVKNFFDNVFTELGFHPSAEISSSRQAVRHGVSVEKRDGKWVYRVIEEKEVRKLLSKKLD
jgi:hypothetical protein